MKNINKGKYKPRPGIMCSAPGCRFLARPGDAFLCGFHLRTPFEAWDRVNEVTGTLTFELANMRHRSFTWAKENGPAERVMEYMNDWKQALVNLGIPAEKIEPRNGEDLDEWEQRVDEALIDFITSSSKAEQATLNLEDDQ